MNNKNYRDRLVDYIKDIGQELIDRAEQMVDEDTDYISNFSIHIKFDRDCIPVIECITEVLTKNTIERMEEGE